MKAFLLPDLIFKVCIWGISYFKTLFKVTINVKINQSIFKKINTPPT